MLTFDAEKHQYFWNGKRVPGVNEIIKAVGLGRSYDGIDPFYRDRGIATHKAIQLWIDCKLDEESVDPVIAPYFLQAKKWYNARFSWDKPYHPLMETEVMKYSKNLNFAGTMDLVTEAHIYDWKCSKSVDPVTEIQGAFYKHLAEETASNDYKFIAIQLDGSDGPAIEIPYEAGYELVEAVMTLYHKWKKK